MLDRVSNSDPLVAEETFGPVAPIIRFETLDEALRLANDTPYGLSAGVVSNHWPSIQRVITELATGTVNVNEAPSYRLEWTPFGGIKASGLGIKEGIIEAMKVFNEIPADVSGKIVAILMDNEDAVEFGKPLFKVDTSK